MKLGHIASKLSVPLAALALLSACASAGPATEPAPAPAPVVVDVCGERRPILVSQEDVLSEGTAEQIEAHNIAGEKDGCW